MSGSVLDRINDGQVLGRVFHRRHCSSHCSKHSTDSVHSVVMLSKRCCLLCNGYKSGVCG